MGHENRILIFPSTRGSEMKVHKRRSHGGYSSIEMVLENLGKALHRKEAFRWVLEHKKGFER